MDLEGIVLSEIIQTEKDTVYFHSHVEYKKTNQQTKKTHKKTQIHEQTKQKQTGSYRE